MRPNSRPTQKSGRNMIGCRRIAVVACGKCGREREVACGVGSVFALTGTCRRIAVVA
jgi:hypothetical protein